MDHEESAELSEDSTLRLTSLEPESASISAFADPPSIPETWPNSNELLTPAKSEEMWTTCRQERLADDPRSISSQQSCKANSTGIPQTWMDPYSRFIGNGTQSSQNSYVYGAYSGTAGASSSPPSQASAAAFASCQQASMDYPAYPTYPGNNYASYYGQNAGYFGQTPYSYAPYLPNGGLNPTGNGALSLTTNNSSASSSPTYQLAQLPPSLSDTNSHYHSTLDNSSPPLKTSSMHEIASLADCQVNAAAKKGPKSGRGRGRRAPNPSPSPEHSLERVFVWDLDETIVIFHSLLTGSFATSQHKDPRSTQDLLQRGLKMEELTYHFAEFHFFFNDLEDCDQVHIDEVSTDDTGQDLSNYPFEGDGFLDASRSNPCMPSQGVRGGVDWMRKLAFRYRRIKEIYNNHRTNVRGLMQQHGLDDWRQLCSDIEELTEQWCTLAKKCLAIISQRENCANVLVTPTQLVPTISKVLINELGQYFPIENIYSSAKVGKDNVFERLQHKYGKKCTLIAIGDGIEEEQAAKRDVTEGCMTFLARNLQKLIEDFSRQNHVTNVRV